MSMYLTQPMDKNNDKIEPTPGFNQQPPDKPSLDSSDTPQGPSAAAETLTSGDYQRQIIETNHGLNENDGTNEQLNKTTTNGIDIHFNVFSIFIL